MLHCDAVATEASTGPMESSGTEVILYCPVWGKGAGHLYTHTNQLGAGSPFQDVIACRLSPGRGHSHG